MSPGSGPATFRPLDYPPSSGKEYAGKPREVVSSAQSPSEMSRNRAAHVWLRTQIPGSGQEFALGKLLLNRVPQAPASSTEAEPNQEAGWGQAGQPRPAHPGLGQAGRGPAQPTGGQTLGRILVGRQVCAPSVSQWEGRVSPELFGERLIFSSAWIWWRWKHQGPRRKLEPITGLAWKWRGVCLQWDLQLTQFQGQAKPYGIDLGSVVFLPKCPPTPTFSIIKEKGREEQKTVVWGYLFSLTM